MLVDAQCRKIIDQSREDGWVLEPLAKALMKNCGLDIPDFILTTDIKSAAGFLKKQGSPVVVKAVSKKILHKTESRAVVVGISSEDVLRMEMNRMLKLDGCENILIEQMVQGVEVIIGAKNDHQFGPVLVFGIGGTSVEIYNDIVIRMAPIKPEDVIPMVQSLQADKLITGYRGSVGVSMEALTKLLVVFSEFVMEVQNDFQSIDLNPVICTKDRCIIADARIILQKTGIIQG